MSLTPTERADRVLELAATPTPSARKSPTRKQAWKEVCAFADREEALFEILQLAPALAADVNALADLVRLCLPYASHVPGVAEKARTLGIEAAGPEPVPSNTIEQRLQEAREYLADVKRRRHAALGQDTFDAIDEQYESAKEALAEIEDEVREAGIEVPR